MSQPSPPRSNIASFFATAWGKLIGALAVVSLIIGILLEIIQLSTAYYTNISARSDAQRKQQGASTSTRILTNDDRDYLVCQDAVLRKRYGHEHGCPP